MRESLLPTHPIASLCFPRKGSPRQNFSQILISRQGDMGVVEKGCVKGEEQASVKAVFLRQIYRQTDKQEHIWTAPITLAEIKNVLTFWKLWGQQGKTRWMSRRYCSESFSGSCTDRDGPQSLDYPRTNVALMVATCPDTYIHCLLSHFLEWTKCHKCRHRFKEPGSLGNSLLLMFGI